MARLKDMLELLGEKRRKLEMPLDELGQRSGVSVSTVKRVLGGGTGASLASVAAIAGALGVDLAARDRRRVADMRRKEAWSKATQLVAMVQATSALESQGLGKQDLRNMVDRTAAGLLGGPRRGLWAAI